MNRLSNYASPLRIQAVSLAVLIAGLTFITTARAVTLDFNVANGNFTTPGNWIDTTNVIPVATSAIPTVADSAFIRNNGTVTIDSNVQALQIRVGHENVITNPDYDNSGVVDAADYVLWRKGGPLQNDATPADVSADDYTYWRMRFGGTPLIQETGRPGTVMWTAGEITGQGNIGGDPYSGGPDIRVGRLRTTNSALDEITGTMVQNGATTKVLLPWQQSQLTIGDGTSSTHTPTSSYTLMNGTIGTAIGNATVGQNNGTNGNDGIRVRNGTFTMTSGQIIDVTPTIYYDANAPANTLVAQRFLTIATATGAGVGSETVATANLNGGTIDSLGGIRVATANHSRGYLNINGPVTIKTGGDTSIGYQPNTGGVNAYGEMNMSAGSFQVGRFAGEIPNQSLTGRFAIGDRGPGTLNISGGSISVTRNIRVVNQIAAAGSVINMTGGTITTPNLEMRVVLPTVADTDIAASVIVDGPTASFIQTTTAGSTGAVIGLTGKALFEVRQGTALLGGGGSTIQVGNGPFTSSIINVKGGKLTLGGPLNKTNTPFAEPVVGLTGGILEFNNTTTTAAQNFQANLTNTGTQLITKANALLQVNVGDATHANNFAMSSGSWNIDMGAHITLPATTGGSDWFNVANGTASLTGGTLNINYLSGFTPNPNEVFTILRGASGVTLNSAAVTIAGSGSWALQTAGTDIQLRYTGSGAGGGLGAVASTVPEPSSAVLIVFAVAGFVTRRKARSRTRA